MARQTDPRITMVHAVAWSVRDAILALYEAATARGNDDDRAGEYRSAAAYLQSRLDVALEEDE